jgi:hypothetical protein
MSKTIAASVIALTLGVGVMSASGQTGVVGATKQAGEVTKDTAKAAGDTTKRAVTAAGQATKKGAASAKNTVTGKAHATCVDGTRQAGKTVKAADAACAKHGGVAKK